MKLMCYYYRLPGNDNWLWWISIFPVNSTEILTAVGIDKKIFAANELKLSIKYDAPQEIIEFAKSIAPSV